MRYLIKFQINKAKYILNKKSNPIFKKEKKSNLIITNIYFLLGTHSSALHNMSPQARNVDI